MADKVADHKKDIERAIVVPDAGRSALRAGNSCEEAEEILCGENLLDQTFGELEMYYTFILTADAAITIDLGFLHAEGDLDLYLLDDNCVAPTELAYSMSSTDNEQIVVPCIEAGQYIVRIDNWDYAEMSFTLALGCEECVVEPDPCLPFEFVASISCGDVVQGSNILDCESSIDGYGCNSWSETGPEVAYELELLTDQIVTATLSGMSDDLDMYLLASQDPTDCVIYGDYTFTSDCLPAGTYYLLVDGYGGSMSDFTLELTCADCGTPLEPCEPFLNATAIVCDDVIVGNNGGCEGVIESYGMGYTETGPEVAYSLELLSETVLTVALSGMTADLDVYLTTELTPTTAIAYGNVSFTTDCLDPGNYYIVVDGYNGAVSDFTLTVTCTDCGADPCEELVCTPIVLDANGHWEIQSTNVDAPDIIDYDNASTGEVCFSITLEEPMALELNTYFPYTDFDTNSYFYAEYMPCDEEYDEATNYIGYNDGASAEDWMTHVFIGDCENLFPAGTYYILISGYYAASIGNFEMHVDVVDCTHPLPPTRRRLTSRCPRTTRIPSTPPPASTSRSRPAW